MASGSSGSAGGVVGGGGKRSVFESDGALVVGGGGSGSSTGDAVLDASMQHAHSLLPLSSGLSGRTSVIGHREKQLIVVSCYTRFDNLAHGPRGREAKQSLWVFELDSRDGQMTLLTVDGETTMNPAFSRMHPSGALMYTCTESVAEHGVIDTWRICHSSGKLAKVRSFDAGGTSTCYITLDHACKNMLIVNYWDATVRVFSLDGRPLSVYDPNKGRVMKARHDKHVNHSENDSKAQAERQADPHSHAVILDPYVGRIAFVPDLGMDIIRQLVYNPDDGSLTHFGDIVSGELGRKALGPRYIHFHPTFPMAYVVNELSSEVSVFEFMAEAARAVIASGGKCKAHNNVLRLVQTVRTVPEAFPRHLNTCGRIAVHPSGGHVFCSNRGHDSIAVFKVKMFSDPPGMLEVSQFSHTRGHTPRHFQFDRSGQWLIAANQDSDDVGVFHFNSSAGVLSFTGHSYKIPSPNFVCAVGPTAHGQNIYFRRPKL